MARKKASFSSFLFGLLFGIIVTVTGLAYSAYWAYNNLTVKKIEQVSGQNLNFLDAIFGESTKFKEMSLKDITAEVQGIPELTFSEFAENYGIVYPSDISYITDALKDVQLKNITSSVNIILDNVKLGNILGAPYVDFETSEKPDEADALLWEIRTYTISGDNGLSGFANELTIGKLESLFNITLPSMLDSLDRNTKVENLGEAIDGIFIADIIPEPAIDPNVFNASANITKVMREMQDPATSKPYTLGNISGLFDNITEHISLQSFIEKPYDPDTDIPTVSQKIIYKIWEKDSKISELSTDLSAVMDDLLIADVLQTNSGDTNSMSYKMIAKLTTAEKNDNGSLRPYKVTEIGEAIEQLYISDVLEEGNPNEMGGRIVNALINAKKTVGSEERPFLITEIDEALDILTVKDVFGETTTGFLSLIGQDTRLADMDTKAQEVITTSTMRQFADAGIITLQQGHWAENLSLQEILEISMP